MSYYIDFSVWLRCGHCFVESHVHIVNSRPLFDIKVHETAVFPIRKNHVLDRWLLSSRFLVSLLLLFRLATLRGCARRRTLGVEFKPDLIDELLDILSWHVCGGVGISLVPVPES